MPPIPDGLCTFSLPIPPFSLDDLIALLVPGLPDFPTFPTLPVIHFDCDANLFE